MNNLNASHKKLLAQRLSVYHCHRSHHSPYPSRDSMLYLYPRNSFHRTRSRSLLLYCYNRYRRTIIHRSLILVEWEPFPAPFRAFWAHWTLWGRLRETIQKFCVLYRNPSGNLHNIVHQSMYLRTEKCFGTFLLSWKSELESKTQRYISFHTRRSWNNGLIISGAEQIWLYWHERVSFDLSKSKLKRSKLKYQSWEPLRRFLLAKSDQ